MLLISWTLQSGSKQGLIPTLCWISEKTSYQYLISDIRRFLVDFKHHPTEADYRMSFSFPQGLLPSYNLAKNLNLLFYLL
jgi:hypothetical protein